MIIVFKQSAMIAIIEIRVMFVTEPKYVLSYSTWKFFNNTSLPCNDTVTLVILIVNKTQNIGQGFIVKSKGRLGGKANEIDNQISASID